MKRIFLTAIVCLIFSTRADIVQLSAGVVKENPIVSAPASLLKQIKLAPLRLENQTESIRVPGRVELDERLVARIGAQVTGRVTDIFAHLGQSVKKGEILATLNSTKLGEVQAEYLKALTQVNLRRIAAKRAERLLESGVISAAIAQERKSELEEVEVALRAAEDQLRGLGMGDKEIRELGRSRSIHSIIQVKSSLSGVVIERHINLGQVVQATDPQFAIADLSQLWLVAEIPEQSAYLAKLGQEASVDIPALPGERVKGKLIYIEDIVDPKTRTVTVRMDLPNPHRRIKPGMLATLHIQERTERTLAIPAQAVVRDNDVDHVFVARGSNAFELRPVELGPDYQGMRKVIKGLKEGERIVVEGSFHLNNERMRSLLE